MLGWIIGALAAGALFASLRRRRHGYAMGYGCGPGWASWESAPPWQRRHAQARLRGSQRGMLRGLFQRLDTTPGQEKAIAHALAGARERIEGSRRELDRARREVAALFASEVLDQAALHALLEGQRALLDGLGSELMEALSVVHEVLDDDQRRELGALLADGSLGRAERARYDL